MSIRHTWTGILAVLCAGCGGGGGGGTRIDLLSDVLSDGFATENGGSAFGYLLAGDENSDTGICGCYRFPLSPLPVGATVTRAVLKTYQFEVIGNPYPSLGELRVHSFDLDDGLSAGLDPGDYGSVAFSTVPGSLSTGASLGERSIDVTAAVQADLAAGRSFSDFRVFFQFGSNGNGSGDQVKLISAGDDGGTGRAPVVTITYD